MLLTTINQPKIQTYEEILTTSGTWSKPAGVPDTATLTVICVGGGGNGGEARHSTVWRWGGSGGGGGAALSIYKVTDLTSVSYTVGAAGGNTQFLSNIGYAGTAGTGATNSDNGAHGAGGYGVGLFVSCGQTPTEYRVNALAASAGFDGLQTYGRGGAGSSNGSITPGTQGAIYLRYEWVK